jgi:hypothetical protein
MRSWGRKPVVAEADSLGRDRRFGRRLEKIDQLPKRDEQAF